MKEAASFDLIETYTCEGYTHTKMKVCVDTQRITLMKMYIDIQRITLLDWFCFEENSIVGYITKNMIKPIIILMIFKDKNLKTIIK